MSTNAPLVAFAVSLALVPFGAALGAAPISAVQPAAAPRPPSQSPLAAPHAVWGVIRSLSGSQLLLQLRNGRTIRVDATAALQQQKSTLLVVSRAVLARGAYDATGVLHAQTILRAKDSPALWDADR